ncbi:MAG: putative toxin-antitoxin system toxin component, PIN family [Bacteroidetes bacterium GWA2_30_7]|nr:MAG: putative toxin-antitoxin system toxin component, PIN family [Bacteroidetes bacterium GWA2_30_7]
MPKDKRIKIVIDVNLFISFLIGKRLKKLKQHIVNLVVELQYNDILLQEIRIVTKRPKLVKYFNPSDVDDLIDLIETIGTEINVKSEPIICRDLKDNYLLGLSEFGKANYLVTGDSDLLVLKEFKGTKIITITEFEKIIAQISENNF